MDGEPKQVTKKDELNRTWYVTVPRKKHFKVRLWFDAIPMVIILTDFLSIVIYPPMWKVGFWDAVFTFRQIPNGAHSSSYLLVFVIILIAFLKWDDALKSLIFGGLMVFIHEGIWFPFYYISNWGSLNIPLDLAFAVWIGAMGFIAIKRYHLRIWKTGLWMMFSYCLCWFMLGFPITVKNISHLAIFYQTQWYGVFTAESNEVMSWILIFSIFLYSLLKLNGKGWKVRELF